MALLSSKTVLERVPQAVGQEASLVDVIAEAQGLADGYCRLTLESTAHDEYHDIDTKQARIVLAHRPVTVITTVTEDPDGTASVLTDGSDFETKTEPAILTRMALVTADNPATFWLAGGRKVRTQYTAGYTASTMPAQLRQALLRMVAWCLDMTADVGTKADNVDGYTRTLEDLVDGVPASIAAAFRPFRREVF